MITEKEMVDAFLATNTSEPLAEGWPGLERFGRAVEKLVETKNGIGVPGEAARPIYKPPLMPEQQWKAERVWDLIETLACNRYASAEDHERWMDELRRLLHDILYKY